jgi:hypothetical protein
MKKNYYMPADDAGRQLWLSNFASKITTYGNTLTVTLAEITSVQNDSAYFAYVFDMVNKYKENVKQRVTYKNLLMLGDSHQAPIGGLPANPTLGVAPTAVAAGIFKRIALLVQRIKNSPLYTTAIGNDLGIIGADNIIDTNALKPIITVLLQAHHPLLKWSKNQMQGIRIYADRDGTGYKYLATDTQPNYLDTATLPDAGTSAVWKYKTIYILHDEEVGSFSDDITVTVSGVI